MTAAMKMPDAEGNSPKKKRPAKKAPAELKEVNLLESLPKPAEAAKKIGPYPEGVQCFSYEPKGGGDPILLPINGIEPAGKLWHFDVAQLPILQQTWAWMRHANVPKEIQRQAQMLPDAEYFKMFDEWFGIMRAAAQAPKDSVTPGK